MQADKKVLRKVTTEGIKPAQSEFFRQHGLEEFMEMQKEKYTCSKCGGIISIHDREWSECQERKGFDRKCCLSVIPVKSPLSLPPIL